MLARNVTAAKAATFGPRSGLTDSPEMQYCSGGKPQPVNIGDLTKTPVETGIHGSFGPCGHCGTHTSGQFCTEKCRRESADRASREVLRMSKMDTFRDVTDLREGDIVRKESGRLAKVIDVERTWMGVATGWVRVREVLEDGVTEGRDGAFLRQAKGLVKVK